MDIKTEIKMICDQIITLLNPEKIILFGTKLNVSGDKIRDIDLCVVVSDGAVSEIEKKIYLNIQSDIQFDVLIYLSEEWDTLCDDNTSYACSISKKGVVVYEK